MLLFQEGVERTSFLNCNKRNRIGFALVGLIVAAATICCAQARCDDDADDVFENQVKADVAKALTANDDAALEAVIVRAIEFDLNRGDDDAEDELEDGIEQALRASGKTVSDATEDAIETAIERAYYKALRGAARSGRRSGSGQNRQRRRESDVCQIQRRSRRQNRARRDPRARERLRRRENQSGDRPRRS